MSFVVQELKLHTYHYKSIALRSVARERGNFAIPIFRPITYTSIGLQVLKEKHLILPKLAVFNTYKFVQTTPDLCNLGSVIADVSLPMAMSNFAKQHLKRQTYQRISGQCKDPGGL